MKRLFVVLVFVVSCVSTCYSQSKLEILGRWEIYKIDMGDMYVDEHKEYVSDTFSNKLKGKKDSALSINLLLGTLKNLMGVEYNFKPNEEVSQYNPNSRVMRNGKYKLIKEIIKTTISNVVEDYKIVSLNKEHMVLEIKIADATKAQIYLKNRS
ncbi:MAG TPA: hypothetical protein VL947_06800 [Cytophagales bacterium]|nr:hypothetical protein [Cytophagales bacterium]